MTSGATKETLGCIIVARLGATRPDSDQSPVALCKKTLFFCGFSGSHQKYVMMMFHISCHSF
jgi:hypothetical protein